MSLPKIKIIQFDGYRVIYQDGYLAYEGDSIPDFEWIDLIRSLGAAEISAEPVTLTEEQQSDIFIPATYAAFQRELQRIANGG
jgi:hypothetical protein